MKVIHRTRRNERRRGAAVIEFAVVAPLLFLLIFGMFEVGRFVNVGEIATAASRYAARQATLSGATVSSVVNQTDQYLDASYVNSSAATTTIEAEAVAGSGNFSAVGSLSSVSVGCAVRVKVTINFAQVSWVPNGFFGSVLPPTVTGVTVMRKEST